MAGPEADRTRVSLAEDATSDWHDRARRRWRRLRLSVAHWRLCLVSALSLLVAAVRRAGRYVLRGDSTRRRRAAGADALLPALSRYESLPVLRTAERETQNSDGGPGERPLPTGRGHNRALPTGRGALEVDRDADRLTISDPAAEEAFLSSTVWVEVEE